MLNDYSIAVGLLVAAVVVLVLSYLGMMRMYFRVFGWLLLTGALIAAVYVYYKESSTQVTIVTQYPPVEMYNPHYTPEDINNHLYSDNELEF